MQYAVCACSQKTAKTSTGISRQCMHGKELEFTMLWQDEVNYVQCAHSLIQPHDHNCNVQPNFDAFTASATRACIVANICFSRFTQSRVKYAWCINDTLDVHDIILHIAVIVQSREFCELGAPRGHVHVWLRPLEWTALWSGLKGLDNVLTMVLVYRGREGEEGGEGREKEREEGSKKKKEEGSGWRREGKTRNVFMNHYIDQDWLYFAAMVRSHGLRKFTFSDVKVITSYSPEIITECYYIVSKIYLWYYKLPNHNGELALVRNFSTSPVCTKPGYTCKYKPIYTTPFLLTD